VRNPTAVRPWQPVAEALAGYLALGRALLEDGAAFATAWNFGPAPADAATVGDLVERFAAAWGEGARWRVAAEPDAPHESAWLLLDSTAARERLGWRSGGGLAAALDATARWYARHAAGAAPDELAASILAACCDAAGVR
jgi:CDP-glucose 4,6-dehydratase